MKNNKNIEGIFIAKTDDWYGIYKDGECIDQGHSIRGSEMLELLGISFDKKWYDIEEVEKMGACFPDKLDDLL